MGAMYIHIVIIFITHVCVCFVHTCIAVLAVNRGIRMFVRAQERATAARARERERDEGGR